MIILAIISLLLVMETATYHINTQDKRNTVKRLNKAKVI